MNLLFECKAILTLLGCGTENYFRIKNHQIPRIFARFFIIAALASCMLLASEYARKNIHREISVILLPLAVAVTYFLQVLIYISITMKNQRIFELISYLEYVVNKRNYHYLSRAQQTSEAYSFLPRKCFLQESNFTVS